MKLFKPYEGRDSHYYVRFQIRGRRYKWCTKTNDLNLAAKRAKVYREQIVNGAYHMAAAMRSRSGAPTFEELFAEYEERGGGELENRKRNIRAMKAVLEAAGLPEKAQVDQLGKEAALAWQRQAGRSEAARNSVLRKARSLFAKGALFAYRAEIPMAMIRPFLDVPYLEEPEMLPDVPMGRAVEAAAKGIPANTDAFNAFVLAAYAGMRSGEIVAARWDWLDGDTIYIGGREFHAKSRKWRAVRLSPETVARLHKNGSKYICGDQARAIVTRALPAILRGYGITGRTPVHNLRRWHGSVIAQRDGLWAASQQLGHSSYAVTEKHYARLLNLPTGISFPVA